MKNLREVSQFDILQFGRRDGRVRARMEFVLCVLGALLVAGMILLMVDLSVKMLSEGAAGRSFVTPNWSMK